jgi:hypothetical protein
MRPNLIVISLLIVALGSFAIGYMRSGGARDATAYERAEAALRESSLLRRSLRLATVFESAMPEEFDEIIRAVEASQIGEGPGLQTFEMLGELWAQRDPMGAIDRSASWDDYARRQLQLPLLRAWARVDGAAARASSETVAEDELRTSAEAEVVLGRFEVDAERAWTEYANGWPYGREALAAVVGRSVYRDGLESLLDRAEDLVDSDSVAEEFRVTMSREVVQIGGRLDPARTARFVEAHADSQVDGLRHLLTPFALGWVQGDPRAVHDWLMTQPADRRRSAALRRAFRYWALRPTTRDVAIEWLEAQPEEARRSLLDLYAQALIDVDPQRAISIAEQIEGPGGDKVVARIRQRVRAQERQGAQ